MFEPQAEGVTQGTESPQAGTEDSTPESIETGASQSQEGSESKGQSNDKEINFKKLRESVGRLEAERAQWHSEREALRGASELDKMLRKDPKNGLQTIAKTLGVDLKALIESQAQSEIPKIDFEQYEPETGKLLKFLHDRASKVEQLEQWKSEFEQKIENSNQQTQQEKIERNMEVLEHKFVENLIKDGYWDKNGQGDMKVVNLIRKAVLAELAEKGDPRKASIEQYQAAYSDVIESLSAHKNKTLQTTVTKSVPATGSRNGTATTAKSVVTKDQRIAMLADMAKSNSDWGFSS